MDATDPELERQLTAARAAAGRLRQTTDRLRMRALIHMADALGAAQSELLVANTEDVEIARSRPGALIDRLTLNPARIAQMAEGMRQVASLPDPLAEALPARPVPGVPRMVRRRVPLGVIAVIFEARPNVAAEIAALGIRSGNALLLRPGREALRSVRAIVQALVTGLEQAGIDPCAIQVVEDPDRRRFAAILAARGRIDLLVPRGSQALIDEVARNSRVPVVETGVGNCHVFLHAAADPKLAERITVNSKLFRPSVCNAAETLLVDAQAAGVLLPRVGRALVEGGTELRACPRALAVLLASGIAARPAAESDWSQEFLAPIMAVRVVDGLQGALDHIERYGTRHSEAIVTSDPVAAQRFIDSVDAAAVYVNAATSFTDGGKFGLGAEVGISTQKLHARGPMGLESLTTWQWVGHGQGEVRT